MGRATRRGKSYAGLAAGGAALMGGYQFITDEEKRKAQEQRMASLERLKNAELSLQSRRLDEAATTRDQNRADAAMNKFLSEDLPGWQAKYIGTDEDAKLRESAWDAVFSDGYNLTSEDVDFDAIAARVEGQFGVGKSGKPLLSASDIEEGMKALRTRAKLRGISEDRLTPDDLRSLITTGFKVGEEAATPAVGDDAFEDIGVEDSAVVDALMGEVTGDDKPFGLGLSQKLSSLGEALNITKAPDYYRNGGSGNQPNPEVIARGFDRGIMQTPNMTAPADWTANYDLDTLSRLPRETLPPQAVARLEAAGL